MEWRSSFPVFLATVLILCALLHSVVYAGPVGQYVEETGPNLGTPRCPKCKSQTSPGDNRVRRDTAQTIKDLAAQFIARGGLQSLVALYNSNDKVATLRSILGQQVEMGVIQGILNRLGQPSRGGGGGGGGGAVPNYGPPAGPVGPDGRWDPAPTGGSATGGRTGPARPTGGTVNPDDTEY